MVKADCRDALALALERGVAGEPERRSFRFYNAVPLPGLDDAWKPAFACEQGFRPVYLDLQRHGYQVENSLADQEEIKPDTQLNGAIVLIGRNRKWNESLIARAWRGLVGGGRLIIAGDKNGGIGAIRKWVSSHAEIIDSFSKYHAIVFWLDKPSGGDEFPVETKIARIDGYQVSEGMFSSDGPDKGSLLLVEHFDDRIRGRIADLGAGWGFLSGELLKASSNVTSINLFEADWQSLKAAEQNLSGFPGVERGFHWIDVTTEFPKKPCDWVIMNPPFHAGRAAEPGLGQRFIEVAASTLPRGGRLLMVANRNLPYEKVLEARFRNFEKLSERYGFKVIEAVK